MTRYALELDPAEIARYRTMAERARHVEAAQWELAGIGPGARVADVGCGPGAITSALAEAVGPSGAVIGVDGDEGALAAARELLAASGTGNADLRLGRAEATGLDAGTFDVVMLRHVLAHNGGSEQAIVDHLASLVRPGGVVYLVDVDLSAMSIVPSTDDIDDMMDRYIKFHRQLGNNPRIGLQLQHLLVAAGLEPVEFTGRYDIIAAPPGLRPPPYAAREAMMVAGLASAEDVERWGRALEALDASAERPLIFPSVFVALGRRPGTES
jgi:SAM-dependent methyltransferase